MVMVDDGDGDCGGGLFFLYDAFDETLSCYDETSVCYGEQAC